MGVPAEGDAARIKNDTTRIDTIRIRDLEQTLAERTEKLERVSELLHDFMVKLCAHDPPACPSCPDFRGELGNLLDDCPGVTAWFEAYKITKAKRDQTLRNRALARMSAEEARALGVWTEWDIFQRGLPAGQAELLRELGSTEPQTGRSVKAAPATDQELIDGLRTYGIEFTGKPI